MNAHAYDEHADRSTKSAESAGAATTVGTPSASLPRDQQVPDEPYDIALRMLDIINRLPDEHAERAWDQLDDDVRGYVFAAGLHRDLERAYRETPAQDASAHPAAAAETSSETASQAVGYATSQATSRATGEAVTGGEDLQSWDPWALERSFDPEEFEADVTWEEIDGVDEDPDQL
jgi:hypothetical protein